MEKDSTFKGCGYKMIPNCKGCQEEYETACEFVKAGHHIATTKEKSFIHKGHLFLVMVNDEGKIVLE